MQVNTDLDRRYIFFYFNRDQPEKIQAVVPEHVRYWHSANLAGYMGDPRSAG